MIKTSKILLGMAIVSIVLLLGANVANAAVIIVSPSDTQGWFAKAENTGTGSLVDPGPAGNPAGPGALELITSGADGQIIQAARIPLVTVGNISSINWDVYTNNLSTYPKPKIEYWSPAHSGTLVYAGHSPTAINTWETMVVDFNVDLWWSTEFGGNDTRTLAAWQTSPEGIGAILSNYFSIGMGSTIGTVPAVTAYADSVHLTGTRGSTGFDDTWNFEGNTPLLPEPPAPELPTLATPVPTISVWGLGLLASLLGLMGLVRRRKV